MPAECRLGLYNDHDAGNGQNPTIENSYHGEIMLNKDHGGILV